jgi:hypothetical protein
LATEGEGEIDALAFVDRIAPLANDRGGAAAKAARFFRPQGQRMSGADPSPDHRAFAGRSARPREGQRGCAAIPRKSEVQHLNRIGRRIILCRVRIAALALIWKSARYLGK